MKCASKSIILCGTVELIFTHWFSLLALWRLTMMRTHTVRSVCSSANTTHCSIFALNC